MKDEPKTGTNIGIVILAAGKSSRLGQPKQLLSYNGRTLLEHSVRVAQQSVADSVMVVLGANAEQILGKTGIQTASIVMNPDWQTGMASSIRTGLKIYEETDSLAEAVILMVADQPFVTSELLNEMMETYRKSGNRIIACKYEETYGTPVLFDKSLFPGLSGLEGDAGAKKMVQKYLSETAFVDFPKGMIDIDSMEDFLNLTNSNTTNDH